MVSFPRFIWLIGRVLSGASGPCHHSLPPAPAKPLLILNARTVGQGAGQVTGARDHAFKDRESLSKTIRRPSKRCRKFDRQGLLRSRDVSPAGHIEDRPNESACHDLIPVTADRPAGPPHRRRRLRAKAHATTGPLLSCDTVPGRALDAREPGIGGRAVRRGSAPGQFRPALRTEGPRAPG